MACESCAASLKPGFDFSMAFQPIYDAVSARIWGYEALVRGVSGEGASEILSKISPEQRYRFDQDCRVKAIELASRLFPVGEDLKLSINFMPNAVYEPAACLRATLRAAARCSFPTSSIMFEFTENEEVTDTVHLTNIITEYRRHGFTTAIDDFGAGHAGLGLLVEFQPDLIKIDMKLVRGIDTSPARRAVVTGIVTIAEELGISVLAEGVETEAEFLFLRAVGIRLFQGYWFAEPAFEQLPQVAPSTVRRMVLSASARSRN
ncbi:EAL domain-containing protein [Arthrobacter frigidicola]|nr:EAL domain-containing protein [Arthrobacter frigidicola]